MRVFDTINRLSDLALMQSRQQRKAEACFLLVSRITPFYRKFSLAGGSNSPVFPIRDHILFLWSHHLVGSPVSSEAALQLERYIPDADEAHPAGGLLIACAQNALICALHLTWYLAKRDDAYVEGCVVNYFDHVDYLAQERLGATTGIPELTELLVSTSRLFTQETNNFEAALLKIENEHIVSRPILIANMDRDVSELP